MMSIPTGSVSEVNYVYELPYLSRRTICNILNQNNKWEDLAGIWMKYDFQDVQLLRNEKNPTDELLTMWGHHNHTILELFVLLSRMQHYQAMVPLKPYVEPKFHCLIDNGEGNLKKLLHANKPKESKDLKIGLQNFNEKKTPQPILPKVVVNGCSSEESKKILNELGQLQLVVPSNSNNALASLVVSQNVTPVLPQIPFSELASVTNNWDKDLLIGKGGFGTVYRATWKNTEVAIKRIERRSGRLDESYALQLQQSFREIQILNSRAHENILPLYAFSLGGEAPCLVYQFMQNGSLEDRLMMKNNTAPLSWYQRHIIAMGTARGLQYLHTIGDKPLIHGDIKSANILLDKNFEARIGDFGLAREGPQKDSMKVSKIQGTRPYLPDEFLHGRNLSTKVDTYSYGIVLFELATGLPVYDKARLEHKFLKDLILTTKDLVMYVDKDAGSENMQVFMNFIILGKWCTNKLAADRPEMELLYQKLHSL